MIILILAGLCLLTPLSLGHVLLQTVTGDVGRGSFIYWSLNYSGNIVIHLISLNGDADLYVSERIAKPDYEPDKYDLHSASCGLDIVSIPGSFRRPIGIGIYGHPSYENSTYLLEIYYDTDVEDNYSDLETNETNKPEETKNKFKLSKSMVISGFWAVMEILELIFS